MPSASLGRECADACTADHLAERGEVRLHAIERLRTAERYAKAGHDFVKDQHGAVSGAELAQRFQETRAGRDKVHVAGDRFHDRRGDTGAFTLKGAFKRKFIVVIESPACRRR